MGLITRFYGPNRKGSELTIKEMDDNLYYLQSIGVDSISYSSNTLTLTNPTGGTLTTTIESSSEFTGNTSGNCITDLYVTNLYGCSPITLNNNIQYKTSSASGEYSFAEGFQTTAGTQTTERITVLSALTINWFLEPKLGQYMPYVSGTCDQLSGLTEQIEFTANCLIDNGESTIVNLTLSGGVDDETIYTTDYQSMSCKPGVSFEGIRFFPVRFFVYTGGTGYTTANLEIITVCEQLGVNYCHSEGINTSAIGEGSHVEGSGTTANGNYSHAEGILTTASGEGSHVEGIDNLSSGYASHAEGKNTIASGFISHAEGRDTIASGQASHAEGSETTASGEGSHAEGQLTTASGNYSHSEGYQTSATTVYSHAEGRETQANGDYSHAEGRETQANGDYSHAEGRGTQSNGGYSHSEGFLTIASGDYSHAEGRGTQSNGEYSHTEGFQTTANVSSSHAEGYLTIANGFYSHAEGRETQANGVASHAEGYLTIANGDYSHAEGNRSQAGFGSHAEGYQTQASGYSHSEGYQTIASGDYSHSEGFLTIASGNFSHTEGRETQANGVASHAEGANTIASGSYSHAEGERTTASGSYSHSEGFTTIASGNTSHAEGNGTKAIGDFSHAEGTLTTAIGDFSHAEGGSTTASGEGSHAEGGNTIASGSYSHAGGINSTVSGVFSFIHSRNSVLTGDRSVLIGGQNLTGDTDDTVYVPYLNINNLGVGTSINNLGIDSNGNVVTGSASETVNYSNVVFVDAINGDDFTGEVNNFLKPFSNVNDALTAADNVVGKSSTNRSLVYIRRGLYVNSGILVFRDNVDVYCEPGVVFTGAVQLKGASDVTSKFLGYASFQSTPLLGSITGIIDLSSIDNFFIDIEFDNIISNQTAIRITSNLSLNHQINISCNYIDTNSFNVDGVNLRNNVNLNLNAKQYIKGMYKTIDIRNHTGHIKIDTPKIILKEGNIYGKSGDFKQALFVNGAGGTDNYTKINADIIVEDPIRYGGITSAVRYWSSPNANIEINGNIEAGVLDAIVLSNGSGSLRFNGTIKTNRGAILSYGSNKVFVNNSVILRETDTFASPFSVGGSSEVFVNNTLYYSAFYGNLINFDSSTAKLYLTNFTAEGFTPPVDEVLTISLIDGGTGYTTDTNVTVTGGTGSGFLVDIEADINGVVTGTTISDGGTGYTVGDVLTIIGGNNDAQIQVDSISTVGTFINVGATTPTIGLNNVATNRSYNNAIVTSYLINLTENPNIIIPKFI